MLQHAEKDVVVTVANRYHFTPKKGVIDCRDEEERLFDSMEFCCHIAISPVLLQALAGGFRKD